MKQFTITMPDLECLVDAETLEEAKAKLEEELYKLDVDMNNLNQDYMEVEEGLE